MNTSTGTRSIVKVTGRSGALVKEFSFDSSVVDFDWNAEDSTLAVLQESGKVFLWNPLTGKEQTIDSSWKGVSICRWAPKGQVLAVGTSKGNLLIINKSVGKKIPILGKHNKAIVGMEWLPDNTLALISEDHTISVNTASGDAVSQVQFNGDPSSLKYYRRAVPNEKEQRVLMTVLNNERVFIYSLDQPSGSNTVELSMNLKHGAVLSCDWHGADQILVAFASGILISVSTVLNPGKEVVNVRESNEAFVNTNISRVGNKIAVVSDRGIKTRIMSDLKVLNSAAEFTSGISGVFQCTWSSDGHFLAAGSKKGAVYVYLDEMPSLYANCDSITAYLISLSEVIVFDDTFLGSWYADPGVRPASEEHLLRIDVEMEPEHLAVSNHFLAVSSHRKVDIYQFNLNSKTFAIFMSFEASGLVQGLGIGQDHAYMMIDGAMFARGLNSEIEYRFGSVELNVKTFFAGQNFVIGQGTREIFHLLPSDGQVATKYSHNSDIVAIYPDPSGLAVAFVDIKNKIFIYDPVEESALSLPLGDIEKIVEVFWDHNPFTHVSTISLFDGDKMEVYRLFSNTLSQLKYEHLCQVVFSNTGYSPIKVHDGTVYCLTKNKSLAHVLLESYQLPEVASEEILLKHYYSGCFKENWNYLISLGIPKTTWQLVGCKVLQTLDLDCASLIYRYIQDFSTLLELENCLLGGNKNYIYGRIAVILNDFDKAQEYFLASDRPQEALYLRQDLHQWDQAMILARRISPDSIPSISLEYAVQLEEDGKVKEAWKYYKEALQDLKPDEVELSERAQAGYIRVCLKLGDVSSAMKLVMNIKNPENLVECANILENMKQFHEAALLYEKASVFEKAADLYSRIKNYAKVGELLPYITSPKLHNLYAKYRESTGDMQSALKSYQVANDLENICRVHIELKQLEIAVKIARESKSAVAAKVVLKHLQQMQDLKGMVEFCILAGMDDQAFIIAQKNSMLPFYGSLIENTDKIETLANLGTYFEQQDQGELALRFFVKSKEFEHALQLLLKLPKSNSTIESAVELVRLAKADDVTQKVRQYLLQGEQTKTINEALMNLDSLTGNHADAAKIGLLLAKSELDTGNYKQAKNILLECIQNVRKNDGKISIALYEMLSLVHSYLLIKTLVKMEQHEFAARLLVRIYKNIDMFPQHLVPILTTGVIECHRANLKKSAFGMAAILCKPENRSQLDEKLRKKIELSVRRPETEEASEQASPCTRCKVDIANSDISCSSCKGTLPFCIASGMHIISRNWVACPHCIMPANADQWKTIVDVLKACPLCETPIDAMALAGNPVNEEEKLRFQALLT